MTSSFFRSSGFFLFLSVINLLASLGFGRFSMNAILPFMKEGLSLTYSQTGMVASSIFFGYLISALLAGHLVIRTSPRTVIISSFLVLIIGILGSAASFNFASVLLSSILIGLGSGGVNVPNVGLVGRWFSANRRGTALGVTNSGSSFGMVFSGFAIPWIITLHPETGWRYSWLLLASISAVIAVINFLWLRNAPDNPIPQTQGVKNKQAPRIRREEMPAVEGNIYLNKTIWIIGGIYFTWGFSYLIFSTFFVDFLMHDVGFNKETAGYYLAAAGFGSIISGFIWGFVSDRLGRIQALLLIYTIQTALLLGFTFSRNSGLLLGETLLYAITLWAVPTIMVAAVNDLVQPLKVPVAVGFITLFFGAGQFFSPSVTGYLIDWAGSYKYAFLLSAGTCFSGALGLTALLLKRKRPGLSAGTSVDL